MAAKITVSTTVPATADGPARMSRPPTRPSRSSRALVSVMGSSDLHHYRDDHRPSFGPGVEVLAENILEVVLKQGCLDLFPGPSGHRLHHLVFRSEENTSELQSPSY